MTDYIRETLLRQAALWRGLFGEEQTEETGEEGTKPEPREDAPTAAMRPEAEAFPSGAAAPVAAPAPADAAPGLPAGAWDREAAARPWDWGRAAAAVPISLPDFSRALQRDARRYDGAFPLYD